MTYLKSLHWLLFLSNQVKNVIINHGGLNHANKNFYLLSDVVINDSSLINTPLYLYI